MGVKHMENVTKEDLQKAGVSKNDYEKMLMLIKMDPDFFIEKYHVYLRSPAHYKYSVDLSKYEKEKIPQKCKEILYRPNKLRLLREKYWSIASLYDKKEKDFEEEE